MKKIFILIVLLIVTVPGFAQRIRSVSEQPMNVTGCTEFFGTGVHAGAKTTALGSIDTLRNILPGSTLTTYKVGTRDSGYVAGINYWNDKAFAERYVNDSSRNMQVSGVIAVFHGKVNAGSTKSVTFKIWDQGGPQMVTSEIAYNGFPNNVLDSIVVPVTQIGIGTTSDTIKSYFFGTATGNVSSFFAGYSIDYNFAALNGDTIGLASSLSGVRIGPAFSYTMTISDFGDTSIVKVLNVQNATLGSDNHWYDNYTQDDSIFNNLAIYPIVVMGYPMSTKGITRSNFTFYGNYPNPAVNSTNIKFSLDAVADVTVQLMDMSGRVIKTIQQTNLNIGEHIIAVNTTELPVGAYVYLIRTSGGDGIGGKFEKN